MDEPKRVITALLALTMVAAVCLRFWNLANQAWLDVEDIQHVGYARDLASKGFLGYGATYILWTVMGSAAQAVSGARPYGEMAMTAIFGVLGVAAISALGAAWHSRTAGLAAAVLLAASLDHIHWSRWAQPQAASIFVGLLGLVLYERALRRDRHAGLLLVAGLTAGLTVVVHESLIVIPCTLVLLELVSVRRSLRLRAQSALRRDSPEPLAEAVSFVETFKHGLERAFVMGVAVATPVVLAETVVRVLRRASGDPHIGSPIAHLWLTPRNFHFAKGLRSFEAPEPLFFWRLLVRDEGPLFVAMAVVGWIGLTIALTLRKADVKSNEASSASDGRKRRIDAHEASLLGCAAAGAAWWRAWIVISCVFAASVLFAFSTELRRHRYEAPLVPMAVLAAAIAIGFVFLELRRRLSPTLQGALIAAFACVWIGTGYVHARPRIVFRTGFQEVWSEVDAHHPRRVAFVGAPGPNGSTTFQWGALTGFFGAETVLAKDLEDVPRVEPAPELLVIAMNYDGTPPALSGFRILRAIPIRVPWYDIAPNEKWAPNQTVFILARQPSL